MSNSSDELFFCLSDLWLIFSRHKTKILLSAVLMAFALSFVFLLSPVKYEIKASFRELQDREESASFKDFLITSINNKSACQASSVMLSDAVLGPLAEQMGLQAGVQKKESLFSYYRKIFLENILTQLKRPLPDESRFVFKDIQYDGEQSLTMFLRFFREDCFEILNEEYEPIGKGEKKAQVNYKNKVYFTVVKTPSDLKLNHIYTVTFSPLSSAVSFLSGNLKIKSHDENRNLLKLSIKIRDRRLGVEILNSLMDEYQKFLINENKLFSKAQLAYLEDRQDELTQKVKKDLDEYALYLSENLQEKGYMTPDQKFDMLNVPYSKYLSKIFSVDMDLERAKHLDWEKNNSSAEDKSLSGQELQRIGSEITQLRQEKDSVNLSLFSDEDEYFQGQCGVEMQERNEKTKGPSLAEGIDKQPLPENAFCDDGSDLMKLCAEKKKYSEGRDALPLSLDMEGDLTWVEKRGKELEAVLKKKKETEELVKYLEKGLPSKNPAASALHDVLKEKYERFASWCLDKNKRCVIADYLKNHLHLLSLRENLLKEGGELVRENSLDWLDLSLAKKTFIEYNNALDQIVLQIQELDHGKKQLFSDSFEISSLSLILKDPVSLDVINKAARLTIETRDTKNRGEKNILRLQDELELQKSFLFHHIEEIIQLNEIKKQLVMDKMRKVKKAIVNGIDQKIFLLNRQAENLLKSKVENLNQEKRLLEEKTAELQREMEILPQKWKLEKMLELKKEMSMNTIQALAQLQESKILSHHLYQLQSRPLDLASLPLTPIKPNLKLIFLLSGFIGIIFAYSFYFVKGALNGFYLSLASLEASDQSVCGTVSFFCEKEEKEIDGKDLETLRRISSKVLEKKEIKVVALLGNEGPNYSYKLAALLGKREKKVLLVDCDFDLYSSDDGDKAGFIKYLKKKIKEPMIINEKEYDYMKAGGYTKYTAELLGSKGFTKLIEYVSGNYDYVLLYSPASLKSADAKVLLNFSNLAVITIKDESMKDLKPYLEWKDDNYCRFLSFVAIS